MIYMHLCMYIIHSFFYLFLFWSEIWPRLSASCFLSASTLSCYHSCPPEGIKGKTFWLYKKLQFANYKLHLHFLFCVFLSYTVLILEVPVGRRQSVNQQIWRQWVLFTVASSGFVSRPLHPNWAGVKIITRQGSDYASRLCVMLKYLT